MSSPKTAPYYKTEYGKYYHGDSERVIETLLDRYEGKIKLIFTSPPFPLNKKKKYGNLTGKEYLRWLSSFAEPFSSLLSKDGSIVVELGNAWEPGTPTMSTLPIESLIQLKKSGSFHLCQEFIYYNPAKLPSPAQWVNIERIRVKDAFTRLWWLSKTEYPDADNKRVLHNYSKDMKLLLKKKKYTSGRRPSEHVIGKSTFLKDNGGSIAPNVIIASNTNSNDPYLKHCRKYGFDLHPARMPIEVAEFFINFLSIPGDIIFDPFAGSNITGYASEINKRKWISIEINEDYIEGSKGRFKDNLRRMEEL